MVKIFNSHGVKEKVPPPKKEAEPEISELVQTLLIKLPVYATHHRVEDLVFLFRNGERFVPQFFYIGFDALEILQVAFL